MRRYVRAKWQVVPAAFDRHTASRILRHTLQPGDVVLTGRDSRLSEWIRSATDSPASHSLLAVSNRSLIEANDHRWNMSERGGGVYLTTVSKACLHHDVDFIAVRRPATVDVDALRRWACWKLLGTDVFATAVLPMQLVRHVGGELRNFLPERHRGVTPAVERAIEAMADGPGRLTCAEFVYRGLLAAGVSLALDDPFFGEEIAALPVATAEKIPDLPRLHMKVEAQLDMWASLTLRHRRPIGSGTIAANPAGPLFWIALSVQHFRDQWKVRVAEPANGDHADFIIPRDLLLSPSLTPVLTLMRDHHGHWHDVVAPSTRR